MSDVCPECGQRKVKRVTTPERARFFAVIDAAFKHWPENAAMQPLNVEDLRTYLQLSAGWGHQVAKGDTVYMFPRSISDRSINHHDFNRLAEKIYLILKTKFHLNPDELLKHEDVA